MMVNGSQFVQKIDLKLREIKSRRQELAEYCGIAAQSLADWTRRGNLPTVDIALKIADFLHVSIDWLLSMDYDYEDGWCEFVDDLGTKSGIRLSPREIMYRIDVTLREKNSSSNYNEDEDFYKDITDIICFAEILSMKKNQIDPGIKKLFLIAQKLNVPLSWLLTGVNDTRAPVPKLHIYGLAAKYPDHLKYYHCLHDNDKELVSKLTIELFQTRRRIQELLLEKGIDISDIDELNI